VTDVVPNIRGVFIGCQRERTFEASQRHVILLSVEAAETQVVEQLCVVNAHLKKPSEKSEGNFWLVRVKVIRSQGGDGFDVGRILLQDEFVVIDGHVDVLNAFINSRDARQQRLHKFARFPSTNSRRSETSQDPRYTRRLP